MNGVLFVFEVDGEKLSRSKAVVFKLGVVKRMVFTADIPDNLVITDNVFF